MIHLTCPDCGWGLFGRAVVRVDAGSVDITCPRCACIVRCSLVKLHDGDPKFNNTVDFAGADHNRYTYDESNNRIALRDVSRQAAANKR